MYSIFNLIRIFENEKNTNPVFLPYFSGETPAAASANSVRHSDMSTIGMMSTRMVQKPFFDDISPRNVTAIVGQPAILNCRVKHVGDRTVSNTLLEILFKFT